MKPTKKKGTLRINLWVPPKRLKQLEELARRNGLAIDDARTPKVIWRLVDDAYNIMRDKERTKEELRTRMESAGIEKWEL